MECRLVNLNNDTILVGEKHGQKNRLLMKLADKDLDMEYHVILIPENTTTISQSFYNGLFSGSISFLGTEKFEQKYSFKFENKNKKIQDIIATQLKEHLEDFNKEYMFDNIDFQKYINDFKFKFNKFKKNIDLDDIDIFSLKMISGVVMKLVDKIRNIFHKHEPNYNLLFENKDKGISYTICKNCGTKLSDEYVKRMDEKKYRSKQYTYQRSRDRRSSSRFDYQMGGNDYFSF